MPRGIIYIARNDAIQPQNHFKIGKSDRADPVHRMKELTSETTNYTGEYVSLGHVLVNDVDECEILVHQALSNYRINPNREFFECSIEEIKSTIRNTLSNFIIEDSLNYTNQQSDETFQREITNINEYERDNKQIIDFISNYESLNFYDACKIANYNNWDASTCPGSCCNGNIRKIFFLLVYKKIVLSKIRQNNKFKPKETFFLEGDKKITKNEALLLQKEIYNTDLKQIFNDVSLKLDNFLKYLSVAMMMIHLHGIEEENRLLAIHFFKTLRMLYPKATQGLQKLDSMKYAGGEKFNHEIVKEIIREHLENQKNLRMRFRR